MSGGNVTIKYTAYASIISKASTVATITNVDYTREEYNKFEKSLVTIARSVMSEHNGGQHGYAGAILTEAAYRKLLGSTTETFTAHTKPARTATYAATATTVEIKQAQEAHAADREQYYMQEGVIEALKYLILNNTPAETLVEIQDDDTDFENVTPLEMMNHLRTNARVTDVFDKKQLLDALNAPIDFSGTLPLKGHFKNVDASIKLLKKHNVEASETIIMVTLLEQIKAHGEFKEDVSKWELKKAADQTWIEFKKFYAAADHERRQREQYGAKTARTVGAIANHVNTIADLKSYIDENLLALAQATTAGLNAVMETPPVATTNATANAATTVETNSLESKVKALEAELKRLKAGKASNGATGEAKPPRVKCPHCKRYHPKVPADKCWALPTNQASKPEGWKPRAEKASQE
jgi:hypothetical protein